MSVNRLLILVGDGDSGNGSGADSDQENGGLAEEIVDGGKDVINST